jgi:hypothetical protein
MYDPNDYAPGGQYHDFVEEKPRPIPPKESYGRLYYSRRDFSYGPNSGVLIQVPFPTIRERVSQGYVVVEDTTVVSDEAHVLSYGNLDYITKWGVKDAVIFSALEKSDWPVIYNSRIPAIPTETLSDFISRSYGDNIHVIRIWKKDMIVEVFNGENSRTLHRNQVELCNLAHDIYHYHGSCVEEVSSCNLDEILKSPKSNDLIDFLAAICNDSFSQYKDLFPSDLNDDGFTDDHESTLDSYESVGDHILNTVIEMFFPSASYNSSVASELKPQLVSDANLAVNFFISGGSSVVTDSSSIFNPLEDYSRMFLCLLGVVYENSNYNLSSVVAYLNAIKFDLYVKKSDTSENNPMLKILSSCDLANSSVYYGLGKLYCSSDDLVASVEAPFEPVVVDCSYAIPGKLNSNSKNTILFKDVDEIAKNRQSFCLSASLLLPELFYSNDSSFVLPIGCTSTSHNPLPDEPPDLNRYEEVSVGSHDLLRDDESLSMSKRRSRSCARITLETCDDPLLRVFHNLNNYGYAEVRSGSLKQNVDSSYVMEVNELVQRNIIKSVKYYDQAGAIQGVWNNRCVFFLNDAEYTINSVWCAQKREAKNLSSFILMSFLRFCGVT